jgi:hypothetical protein
LGTAGLQLRQSYRASLVVDIRNRDVQHVTDARIAFGKIKRSLPGFEGDHFKQPQDARRKFTKSPKHPNVHHAATKGSPLWMASDELSEVLVRAALHNNKLLRDSRWYKLNSEES